uniref:Reverse transcriptase domain-containing protein n=1 Tax=Strongyloides venezuelensis TaxID=75913 RepID=A0A0K0FRF2_STRVS
MSNEEKEQIIFYKITSEADIISTVDGYFMINEFKRLLVPPESKSDSFFKNSAYLSKFRREDKSISHPIFSDRVKDKVNNTDSSELVIKTDSIKHSPEADNSTISWGNGNLQSKKTLVDGILSYSSLVYEAIHANVSKIGLTKNITCRFYVFSCNENSISGGLCQELDISVDDKLEEARTRKKSFIAQLNELNESQPHIVSYLLSHPKIFDDSILQPVLITSIPLSSTPERKLFRSYRPKEDKLKYLAKTLRKEIVEGKIRQEFDPYLTSPTHVINESKPRLVIDAKQLNEHIQDIYLSLLFHQDMQDRIAGAKRFYRFDFTAVFKSIALKKSDKYIFGFLTTFGSYVFNVLNFGYSCSAQVFQQKLEQLFQTYNIQNYLLYISDTLLFGDHTLEINKLKFL